MRILVRGKRSSSSRRWLQRHMNDPFVRRAQKEGYRSRAAYKLMDAHQRYDFLHNPRCVIDLGCAPGAWLQVVRGYAPRSRIIGIDILAVDPLEGADIVCEDFVSWSLRNEHTQCDVLLSDMRPSSTGHRQTDILRAETMMEKVMTFAQQHLEKGGHIFCKTLQQHWPIVKQWGHAHFRTMNIVKPDASRLSSSEIYIVGCQKLF